MNTELLNGGHGEMIWHSIDNARIIVWITVGYCIGLNSAPPPIHVHLETVNVTLFGGRVFPDVIKLRWSHTGVG